MVLKFSLKKILYVFLKFFWPNAEICFFVEHIRLQSHIRILESTSENKSALLLGLEYLIDISYVDDTEVFKVLLLVRFFYLFGYQFVSASWLSVTMSSWVGRSAWTIGICWFMNCSMLIITSAILQPMQMFLGYRYVMHVFIFYSSTFPSALEALMIGRNHQ